MIINEIVYRGADVASEFYEIIKYPDGQKNIRLNLEKLNSKLPCKLVCRAKRFEDLEVIGCLIAALKKNDLRINHIFFVYLFGMRSDRSFLSGQPNYFKDVICPVIKSLGIENVRIFSPHNISNLIDLNAQILTSINYEKIEAWTTQILNDFSKYFVIGGDESYSSLQHAHFIKKRLDHNIEVFLENMDSLEKTTCPILIADDLCDAGGTFIAEAEYIKKIFPNRELYLRVDHGLFTKGLDALFQYFTRIITTNSYQDLNDERIIQIKVI